jgi:DNA-binding XRE family transcriptional regulator
MKRKHKFRWCDLALYIGVSTQCVDSYANGRSHPQIMKYYSLCEYIAKYTKIPINTIIIQSMEYIKLDLEER